jgi:outer membrane protein TolC
MQKLSEKLTAKPLCLNSTFKTLPGYPLGRDLPIEYDTIQMENEVLMDTVQQMNYTEHIDYKILYSQRELQNSNIQYSYWGFLPSLSAFGSYILNFQNDQFGELYQTKYPYSYVGATLAFPIFQGGKRTARIKEEKLRGRRLDLSLADLRNNLGAEYSRAIAAYKSNLTAYLTQKKTALAEEVYQVINLQYLNGVRPYLDVTVAESDCVRRALTISMPCTRYCKQDGCSTRWDK